MGDDLFLLPRNGTAPLAKGFGKGVSERRQHIQKKDGQREGQPTDGLSKNFGEREKGQILGMVERVT